MSGSDLVCVRVYGSWHEAELAKAALLRAGIDAVLQGAHSGRLLASLIPERFPVLVIADQAEAARELLDSLADAPARFAATVAKPPTRRWRVTKLILAFHVYALLCFVALVTVGMVGWAIADATHATPYGHALALPFDHGYVVVGLALLLTFSRWVRDRGLIIVPVILIVLVAASLRARTAPRQAGHVDTSRSRSAPWR